MGWVSSFIDNRKTTLLFNSKNSDFIEVGLDIPQESPISPLFYLFYGAELLKICNKEKAVSAIGFVDDTNILT